MHPLMRLTSKHPINLIDDCRNYLLFQDTFNKQENIINQQLNISQLITTAPTSDHKVICINIIAILWAYLN